MTYAVVEIAGSQYQVNEGQRLELAFLESASKPVIEIDKVMLFVDGEKTLMGMPFLTDVTVKAKVLKGFFMGRRLKVSKFKAKSRYRKTIGFRPKRTLLEIEKIVLKEAKLAMKERKNGAR